MKHLILITALITQLVPIIDSQVLKLNSNILSDLQFSICVEQYENLYQL